MNMTDLSPSNNKTEMTQSLRFQIYLLLILLSSGMIFGRIIAVDNVANSSVQEYRLRQIPQQLSTRHATLLKKGMTPDEIKKDLTRAAKIWVQDAKKDRPTLSANDRSRWLTIRALVEPGARVYRYLPCDQHGKIKSDFKPEEVLRNCGCACRQQFNKENAGKQTYVKQWVPYAVDKAMETSGWDTIDMVKHGVAPEKTVQEDPFNGYLYSSKPTLLPSMMAVPYWILYHGFGLSLSEQPFTVVRILLVLYNLIPLAVAWLIMAIMIDRLGNSDWTRIFAMAAVCFATFLSTFAVTLNNHLPGVVCIVLAIYGAFKLFYEGDSRLRWFALTGFFGTLAIACELPAAAITLLLCLLFLIHYPKRTLAVSVPLGLLVMAGFFATNIVAHHTYKPAYAQKRNHIQLVQLQQKETTVADTPELSYDPNDWYIYRYFPSGRERNEENARISYWSNRVGIDRGESSHLRYLFHATLGHHGVFSLSPIWCLSMLGIVLWLVQKQNVLLRRLAGTTLALTTLFLIFYLTRDQGDRNYGGMTCGLRWFFPLIPLWILCSLPILDIMSRSRFGRSVALLLLFCSAMSVTYPLWNPWSHPWFYCLMDYCKWLTPF